MCRIFFGIRVADLAIVFDANLHQLKTTREIAAFHQRVAKIPRGDAFSGSVADLAGNGEALLVKLDGAAGLAEGRVGGLA